MRSTHLPTIAKVRFLVGALGEQLEWWRTQFTRETSQRSLELLFPRTAVRAALESVTEAARRTHDVRLGPRSFHLFRLPVHLEDRLAGWLAKAPKGLVWPPRAEAAIVAELERIGGTEGAASEGPREIGTPELLDTESAVATIAATYARAARIGVFVIPYLE